MGNCFDDEKPRKEIVAQKIPEDSKNKKGSSNKNDNNKKKQDTTQANKNNNNDKGKEVKANEKNLDNSNNKNKGKQVKENEKTLNQVPSEISNIAPNPQPNNKNQKEEKPSIINYENNKNENKTIITDVNNEVPTEMKNNELNNNITTNNNIKENTNNNNLNDNNINNDITISIKIEKKEEEKKEEEKENQLLKLYENSKLFKIKKDSKDKISNSNYSINLKVTLRKVKSSGEYFIHLYQYEDNTKSNKNLIGTSENRIIKPEGKVTFSYDFIVNYDFTKIQPLEFLVEKNNYSDKILAINLGDIIGKSRQIYVHNFDNYDLEIEAIMHSEIKKKIIFLIEVTGDLKGLNLFYTISNLGNRYDNNKNELVYKSDTKAEYTEINFNQIEIPLEKLSDDDNLEDNLIQIAFFKDGGNELGKEKFSINQILQSKEIELKLIDDIKAKILCERKNFFTFLQFLYNDFHLVTTFCIDFSNNNSVHNNNSKFKELITTFLNVLVPYNNDKFFNCYAYGLKLLKTGKDYLNEIFYLNRKTDSTALSEVIPKYEKLLTKIEKLSSKTNLTLIIRCLNNKIKENFDLEDHEYNLFIIFACNDIENEEEFIKELMVTCSLNISIVVIGIGKGSYDKLQKTIDNIKTNLLKRDCIQFFKFGDNINEIVKNSLINIPDTMIDFFCQNNVLPKN